jgi:hypothetical protein
VKKIKYKKQDGDRWDEIVFENVYTKKKNSRFFRAQIFMLVSELRVPIIIRIFM